LIFTTDVKSISLISEVHSVNETTNESKHSIKFVEKAIQMLTDVDLPPPFYPDFGRPGGLTVSTNEVTPILTSAFTVNENTVFIRLSGGRISMIPLSGLEHDSSKILTVPALFDAFSLVSLYGFRLIAPETSPPLFNFASESSFAFSISFHGHFFSSSNTFTPTIVTDCHFLYSVAFGASPRVKVFELSMDSILFVRAIFLRRSKAELLLFPELLPEGLKDTEPVATNGIYLGAILQLADHSVCRIFNIKAGLHFGGVPLFSPIPLGPLA
jgi:hypothetical protein